jgi:hypothetical protein
VRVLGFTGCDGFRELVSSCNDTPSLMQSCIVSTGTPYYTLSSRTLAKQLLVKGRTHSRVGVCRNLM